jgi:hypothetical protein
MFMWGFCVDWIRSGRSGDAAFVGTQRLAMARFDQQAGRAAGGGEQAVPPARSLAPATARRPAVPTLAHSAGPSVPQQAVTSPLPPQKTVERVPAASREPAPTLTSAVAPLPAPALALGPSPVASRKRNGQKRPRQTEEDASRVVPDDHEGGGERNVKKMRSQPTRGIQLIDPPCRRCARLNQDCYEQVNSVKACYSCGKLKTRCDRQDTQPARLQAPSKPKKASRKKRMGKKIEKAEPESEDSEFELPTIVVKKAQPAPAPAPALPTPGPGPVTRQTRKRKSKQSMIGLQ